MPRMQRNPAGHVARSRSPDPMKAMDPPLGCYDNPYPIRSEHNRSYPVMSDEDDEETAFTQQFIEPHQRHDDRRHSSQSHHHNNLMTIDQNQTMESTYYPNLEAKPTRATLAETFSSGGEFGYDDEDEFGGGPTFASDLDGSAQFIDLAHEAANAAGTFDSMSQVDHDDDCRDDYLRNHYDDDEDNLTSYEDGEFLDMAKEAAQIPSRHYTRTTTTMQQDEFESFAELYGREEVKLQDVPEQEEEEGTVLQFVDSEDGQAFTFPASTNIIMNNNSSKDHHRLATTMAYEQYTNSSRHSRTLPQTASAEGTSTAYDECSKTLNTNLETLHTDLEGVNYIPTMNEHDIVHDPAYHLDTTEGESYDDDEERIGGGFGDGAAGVAIPQTSSYVYQDDGYVRYNENDGPEAGLQNQDTFQETIDTYDNTDIPKSARNTPNNMTGQDGEEYTEVLSQIMDSYLSDRSSSSWDEGSYASRSRAVSRLDSFDGTEFTEDHRRGNGLLVDILKNFRDTVRDRDIGSDDEDDYDDDDQTRFTTGNDDKSRRTSRSKPRRRRSKRDLPAVLGELGTIGMDLLNETLEQTHRAAAKQSRRQRRRGNHQAGKIMNSIADIFSCGAPSHY